MLAHSMGAGNWASSMVAKIEREYGVDHDRALQITNKVRELAVCPDIEALKEAGLLNDKFISGLFLDLEPLLEEQEEETIEARWNALAKDRGIYDVVGVDALLYDPAKGGLDPNKELVSADGKSITIQEAMFTAWWDGYPVEALPRGLQIGNTEFQTKNKRQITFCDLEDGFDQDALSEQLSQNLQMGQLEVETDLLVLEDIDFSIKASRQDCVLAIAATRRYILEHDGVSRDEIMEAMEPEKNYPLGIHGVQARAKGFECAFRNEWWDGVIAPGLCSLLSIQQPAHKSGKWYSVETLTGGFESKITVKNILDDGYLFEISYRDSNEKQRVVGYHKKVTRPSAIPLNGPPVFRFQPIVGKSPTTIRLPALRELRPISLEQLPESIWNRAISELVTLADEHGEQIPLDDVQLVVERIQKDQINAIPALTFITLVFGKREDIRESVADELEAMLLARLDLLTHKQHAEEISKCLGITSEVAPERVLDAVPAMASAADLAATETRQWLIYAFSNIAETFPEELLPAVQTLIECIEESDENLRTNALSTLGQIAHAYPDAARNITDSVGDLLTSDNAMIRANAAGLLGDIAQSNPEPVIQLAPELAESLTAEDEETRVNASIALLQAGEASPEAVRDEHEQLATALTDSNPFVRANACTLIGNADAPVLADQLQQLKDDPNERVREQAAWALRRIS